MSSYLYKNMLIVERSATNEVVLALVKTTYNIWFDVDATQNESPHDQIILFYDPSAPTTSSNDTFTEIDPRWLPPILTPVGFIHLLSGDADGIDEFFERNCENKCRIYLPYGAFGNYDGRDKHRTRVGAGAFIGSDTVLVAPVEVGDGAYVAAGSAITKNVPRDALAVGRGRQVNKEGWAKRRRAKTKSS